MAKELTQYPMIYGQMAKVMRAIGAIGKTRTNAMQHYNFRGIDDVYNAVNGAMADNGVFAVPCVLEQLREEKASKNGGMLIYTILKMRYTFYAEDGSNIESVVVGESMDSGDKSANKSMSAAQKYCFLQTFAIPTEEQKDTEYETHEVKATAKPEAKKSSVEQKVEVKTKPAPKKPESQPESKATYSSDVAKPIADKLLDSLTLIGLTGDMTNLLDWTAQHTTTINGMPEAIKAEIRTAYKETSNAILVREGKANNGSK